MCVCDVYVYGGATKFCTKNRERVHFTSKSEHRMYMLGKMRLRIDCALCFRVPSNPKGSAEQQMDAKQTVNLWAGLNVVCV